MNTLCQRHIPHWIESGNRHYLGIGLSAAIGMLSIYLADTPWLQGSGISGLTLAIVIGMVLGNSIYPRITSHCAPGVGFSKHTLLRLGIVLYGFRLTVQDISQVGVAGVLVDACIVVLTFALAVWLGISWLGLDKKTAMLIGAGSSICGAAAVLAASPVVKAREEQVAVAVATVVVFGTIATFLYPALSVLNTTWTFLSGGDQGFGIYIGATVHEVAQVVAAGNSVSASVANTAVIAKMVRVMMLAPFLLGLSFWLRKRSDTSTEEAGGGARPSFPLFSIGFVLVVLFNSLGLYPSAVNHVILNLDNFLLAMAMASLGLTTHAAAIKRAGAKPLVLAAILFAWLVAGGGLLTSFWVTVAG